MALPDRIGPFEVLGLLGQGGMGAVYRARHSTHGFTRALKVVLRPEDPVAAARFEREAQALAAVAHPSIVGVHEVGAAPDPRGGPGVIYMAMDLVEGDPLDRVLEGGPLPVPDALRILAEAAEGVAALHRAGIVHRDLKPQNILVPPTGGRAVVLDLGLALSDSRERLTRSGAVVGTVGYLAPEQLEGKATPRTDVHALGLVLYEALTGAPAIEGDSEVAAIAQLLRPARPRPSATRACVSPDIDALVARAFARQPDERFADAGELASALRAALAAPPPRAHRGALVALGLAALVVVSLAAALAARGPGAPGPAPDAPGTAPGPGPARPDPAAGSRELALARRLIGRARVEALAAWQRRWPVHPDAGEAGRLLRAGLRDHPRVRVVHQRVIGAALITSATPGARAGDIVTVGADQALRVWDGGTGALLREVATGIAPAHLVLLPGRAVVTSARADPGHHGAMAVDLASGRVTPFIRGRAHAVSAIAASPAGDRVVIGRGPGAAGVLEAEGPRDPLLLDGHDSPVVAVGWSADGGVVVTCSGASTGEVLGRGRHDDAVRAYDSRSGAPRFRVLMLDRPNVVVGLPDGRFAVGSNGGTVIIIDATGDQVHRLNRGGSDDESEVRALDGAVRALACTPDGRRLFAGSSDVDSSGPSELVAWSLAPEAELRRVRREGQELLSVSADGRALLAASFREGAAAVWDVDALTSD